MRCFPNNYYDVKGETLNIFIPKEKASLGTWLAYRFQVQKHWSRSSSCLCLPDVCLVAVTFALHIGFTSLHLRLKMENSDMVCILFQGLTQDNFVMTDFDGLNASVHMSLACSQLNVLRATCFAQGIYGIGNQYPVNLKAIVCLRGWLPS